MQTEARQSGFVHRKCSDVELQVLSSVWMPKPGPDRSKHLQIQINGKYSRSHPTTIKTQFGMRELVFVLWLISEVGSCWFLQ